LLSADWAIAKEYAFITCGSSGIYFASILSYSLISLSRLSRSSFSFFSISAFLFLAASSAFFFLISASFFSFSLRAFSSATFLASSIFYFSNCSFSIFFYPRVLNSSALVDISNEKAAISVSSKSS